MSRRSPRLQILPHRKRLGRILVIGLIAVLTMYVVLPQMRAFRDSLTILADADMVLMIAAFTMTLVSFFYAAVVYWVLSGGSLRFGNTLLVQVVGAFINRIVPAGVGGIGLNAYYLRRSGFRLAAAGAIVAVNNILGFFGHMLIVLLTALVFGITALPDISFKRVFIGCLVIIGLLTFLYMLAVRRKQRSKKLTQAIRLFLQTTKTFATRPRALSGAVLGAVGITISMMLSLWFTANALGVDLLWPEVVMVVTFGVLGATITPTPGGIVGAEAALTGALVAAGQSSSSALAVALAYRLVTYWLPMICGVIAFMAARKRSIL